MSVLAYLTFVSVASLLGITSLIFPKYILDEGLGIHSDRARGPFLQAVANGVTLNLLGLSALDYWRRGRLRGPLALLLAVVPLAILATMTRAVWLSFSASILAVLLLTHSARVRKACAGLVIATAIGTAFALSMAGCRIALEDRLQERSPVEFRVSIYQVGWEMAMDKPWFGWGQNQMPEEIAKRMSDYRPDTYCAHNTYLEVGKKTVVTVHGLDWQRRKWGKLARWALRLGEWAAVRMPNSTIVVSRTLRDYYRSRYGVETTFIPSGTEIREKRINPRLRDWGLEACRYVLFLGRFSPEKNCDLLIRAFQQVEGNVKLVLAGGSSYSDPYVAELRKHQSDRILLLNWVAGEALQELLTNAALFVMPSDMEGLSLALLDAMGAAVCVLASDVPENRELVDGVGFTFRHGDEHDLARMLQLLLADDEIRARAGQACRQRVREQYLWPKITRQIEQEYFRVMGWDSRAASKSEAKSTKAA